MSSKNTPDTKTQEEMTKCGYIGEFDFVSIWSQLPQGWLYDDPKSEKMYPPSKGTDIYIGKHARGASCYMGYTGLFRTKDRIPAQAAADTWLYLYKNHPEKLPDQAEIVKEYGLHKLKITKLPTQPDDHE